jgi:hypothetical protein
MAEIYSSYEDHLANSKLKEIIVDYERIPHVRTPTFKAKVSKKFEGVDNIVIKYLSNKDEAEKILSFNKESRNPHSVIPKILNSKVGIAPFQDGERYIVVEEQVEIKEDSICQNTHELYNYIFDHIDLLEDLKEQLGEKVLGEDSKSYDYFSEKNIERVSIFCSDFYGKSSFNEFTNTAISDILEERSVKGKSMFEQDISHGNYHGKNRTNGKKIIDLKSIGPNERQIDLVSLLSTMDHNKSIFPSDKQLMTLASYKANIPLANKKEVMQEYISLLKLGVWYNAVFAQIAREEMYLEKPESASTMTYIHNANFFANKLFLTEAYDLLGNSTNDFSIDKEEDFSLDLKVA